MSFDAIGAVAWRTWVKTFRRPVLLTFSFVQPIMWLLLFGFLFERVRPVRSDLRYLDYFAPGVGAMTVLFGASQSGIAWIRDLDSGFLRRMLRTPTSDAAILFGKLLADSLRLLLQAVIVLGLAFLLGARVSITPAYLPWGLLCLGLFAFAFASLSSYVALRTGLQEAMAAYVHVINLPLLFTSTVLIPRADMPGWLGAVGKWNPLTLAVDAWRGAVFSGERPRPLVTFAVLAGFALAMFALTLAAMRRPVSD